MKSWFFVKINKIEKQLSKLTDRKKNQIIKSRREKGSIAIYIEIKRIIRIFLKDKLHLTKRCK